MTPPRIEARPHPPDRHADQPSESERLLALHLVPQLVHHALVGARTHSTTDIGRLVHELLAMVDPLGTVSEQKIAMARARIVMRTLARRAGAEDPAHVALFALRIAENHLDERPRTPGLW